jgi:hypothetical protein
VDPAELAMAAAPLGGAGKRSRMIGAEGVQVTSYQLAEGKGWRIDVENPKPGQRPGQIHIQDYRGGKWQYDFETHSFMGLPRGLEKEIMRSPRALRAIEHGLRMLEEGG